MNSSGAAQRQGRETGHGHQPGAAGDRRHPPCELQQRYGLGRPGGTTPPALRFTVPDAGGFPDPLHGDFVRLSLRPGSGRLPRISAEVHVAVDANMSEILAELAPQLCRAAIQAPEQTAPEDFA